MCGAPLCVLEPVARVYFSSQDRIISLSPFQVVTAQNALTASVLEQCPVRDRFKAWGPHVMIFWGGSAKNFPAPYTNRPFCLLFFFLTLVGKYRF